MKELAMREWMNLNRLIYNIYNTDDLDELRTNFLHDIHVMLDFDSADFYLYNPRKNKLCNPICFHRTCEIATERDLSEAYGVILRGEKSKVYRKSDWDKDGESQAENDNMLQCQVADEVHELNVVLIYDRHLVGGITFYRSVEKDDFLYDDVFLMDQIKDHLALHLAKESEVRGREREKVSVSQAVGRYGLTKREHMVLRRLMDGDENVLIAEELDITVNTLKKHILNIYRKLEVSSRTQLFKKVREKE